MTDNAISLLSIAQKLQDAWSCNGSGLFYVFQGPDGRKSTQTSPLDHELTTNMPHLSRWQMNDKIGRFCRPIFSAKLEPSSTAKFIVEILADKIGRVTYKQRPIFVVR